MPYDPDADRVLIWANADPQSGYFYQKDGVRSGFIEGIMSCWQVDLEVYDSTEVRDEPSTAPSANGDIGLAFEPLSGTAEYIVHTPDDNTAPVTTTVDTDTMFSTNDDILHIPPRPVLHKETWLQFWDDAGATGNVVYQCEHRLRPVFEASEQPFIYIN